MFCVISSHFGHTTVLWTHGCSLGENFPDELETCVCVTFVSIVLLFVALPSWENRTKQRPGGHLYEAWPSVHWTGVAKRGFFAPTHQTKIK